jgi:glycosyltransferase involved in cell wall biosynthesis
MKISVIIPTYNEEKVIEECIFSLSEQNYKDLEIIVVDDGSTDGTSQKLRAASKTANLKVLSQDHQGPAMARNLGAKHAKGEILVFVDSDMTFDKKFLSMLVRPIVAGKSKGTFSRDEYVSNWQNDWARCWNINQGWEKKKRHPKKYQKTQKVFRAILKKEFDRVGGFDKGGYTDDYTLADKLGYYATLAPKAFFYHKNPDSLKEVFLQAKWSAKRRYKLGPFGIFVTMLRSSLPFSTLNGILKAVLYHEPNFIFFKIIYDLGISIGVLEYAIFKKGAK